MTIEFVLTLCVVGSSLKAARSTVKKHFYESKSNALGIAIATAIAHV